MTVSEDDFDHYEYDDREDRLGASTRLTMYLFDLTLLCRRFGES